MDALSIGYITAEIAIGLVTLVGNFMVLLAIYRNKPLRTATNCFIGSLALADLFVGISVPPLVALSFVGLPHNFLGCVFINSLVVVFTQISIFGLLAIAMERFIAIKYPFAYQKHVTIFRSIITLLVTFILACVVGLVPMFGWNKGPPEDKYCAFTKVIGYEFMVYFNFFGFVLAPLLIMFGIYIYIFSIVQQQMTAMAALNITNSCRKKKKFLRDIKAAKSLAMVLVLFAVCWLPIHVCNCLSLFCKQCKIPFPLLLSAILLSHANSMFNPVLYAYGNSKFKRAFRRMCCCPLTAEDRESTDYITHKQQEGNDNSVKGGSAGTNNPETETTQASSSPVINGEIEFSTIIHRLETDVLDVTDSGNTNNTNTDRQMTQKTTSPTLKEKRRNSTEHGSQQNSPDKAESTSICDSSNEVETFENSNCDNQTNNNSESLPNDGIFITHL